MRRAARRDELHGAVGGIFRDHKWDALDLAGVGDGCPDWLMVYGWFAALVEVKNPETVKRTRDKDPYTPAQKEFHARWTGPIFTVDSIEATWALIEMLEKQRGGS